METKGLKVVFLVLFLLLFLGMVFPIGYWVVDWRNLSFIVCFVGFQVIALGICYDLTELILAMSLKTYSLPQVETLTDFPKVALLYTTCDDVVEECLSQLDTQKYPNYDIFILDDSTNNEYKAIIDRYSHYTIVRRDTKKAYKAGNLNHWLYKYGHAYKYFVILDTDSKTKPDFIGKMMKYAEHPSNADVGIFQSKIFPWNQENAFSIVTGMLKFLRIPILEKVESRLDMLFAFGCNGLYRTLPIKAVGGFNEIITPEDTAITLALSEIGFKCKLVDVISFDTEPSNIFTYAKRDIRWGRQTVETFRLPWKNSALSLKFVLCRHLLAYITKIMYPLVLVFSIWGFTVRLDEIKFGLYYIFSNGLYFYFILCLSPLLFVVANLLFNFLIAKKYGISCLDFMKYSIFWAGILPYFWYPLSKGLLHALAGGKTVFKPTNSYRMTSDKVTFSFIISNMKVALFISSIILLGVAIHPTSLLLNLNILWVPFYVLSPGIIWYFHKAYWDSPWK